MSFGYVLSAAGMRYGDRDVLHSVSVAFNQPGLVAIAGPNGAGKSTLLNVMAGLRESYAGSCQFESREVRAWPRRAFARRVAVVPQALRLEFPFTAEQVVLMGRTPYCDGLFESPEDLAHVENAMAFTDTLPFRTRDFRDLSGGERQRVILASALAQDTPVLLLDEPTTFLDLHHQVSLYQLLRRLAAAGRLIIAVTHDLNLAATYSDRVLLLSNGAVAADGPPAGVLTPARIRDVFSVDVQRLAAPDGRSWIVYGRETGHA
ncbi:MAG: ABC transporter ATP-binding protein [Bryobacteraceae bacterium]|nr:ABC transporter ATP-binding protein [Bryobacteraceae bacterium]